MNWGYKIMLTYLVFVAGILLLIVKATGESFDLVEQDYYHAELKYQDRIDEQKRTATLSEKTVCSMQSGNVLKIVFPKEFSGKRVKGELHLYAPSDEKKDWKKQFDQTGILFVQLPDHLTGYYQLKLRWESERLSYYHEENIHF